MQPRRGEPRFIAIDVRAQQFGYAVFEGFDRLLDYGGGQLRPGGQLGAALAVKRIRNLIQLFAPSTIVLRRPEPRVAKKHPGIHAVVSAIRREASMRLVPHRLIAREEIRAAFHGSKALSKYQIAMVLVEMFPELNRKLPPPRSLGDPEHPRMVVFDAISVGVTYRQLIEVSLPP
jgi:hypothetical protein